MRAISSFFRADAVKDAYRSGWSRFFGAGYSTVSSMQTTLGGAWGSLEAGSAPAVAPLCGSFLKAHEEIAVPQRGWL